MITTDFKELDLKNQLDKALDKMEFTEMTPIQSRTFQPIMEGRDIMALAPTGTGKTCAFGLPLLQMIDPEKKELNTIVLCPTRELAKQTADVLHQLTKFMHGIKVIAIYGGENIGTQIKKLKGRPQIIVATPGRFMDHMQRRTIKVQTIERVVLDEADRMLDMGFRQDIDKIIKNVPKNRQMIMFSATMSKAIREISNKHLKNEVNVEIENKSKVVDTVKQYSAEVNSRKKTNALIKLFNEKSFDSSLVFVRTKSKAKHLSRKLSQKGLDAIALHGDLNQNQRDKVMKKYKNGNVSILVATDVASRGLDIDNIGAVVNYDLPEDSDSYVHRIGRTGRANQTGDAYTLYDPTERRKMNNIIKITNADIESIMLQEQSDKDAYDNKLKEKSLAFSYSSRGRRGRGKRR